MPQFHTLEVFFRGWTNQLTNLSGKQHGLGTFRTRRRISPQQYSQASFTGTGTSQNCKPSASDELSLALHILASDIYSSTPAMCYFPPTLLLSSLAHSKALPHAPSTFNLSSQDLPSSCKRSNKPFVAKGNTTLAILSAHKPLTFQTTCLPPHRTLPTR